MYLKPLTIRIMDYLLYVYNVCLEEHAVKTFHEFMSSYYYLDRNVLKAKQNL